MFKPKALSLRSMVWRFSSGRREVRREERAGGISDKSREVKMSARFMVWRDVWEERRGARAEQAGAPRVLPLRWIVVWVLVMWRGEVCGWVSSAVSSFRPRSAREKVVGEDIVGMMVVLSLIIGPGLCLANVNIKPLQKLRQSHIFVVSWSNVDREGLNIPLRGKKC